MRILQCVPEELAQALVPVGDGLRVHVQVLRDPLPVSLEGEPGRQRLLQRLPLGGLQVGQRSGDPGCKFCQQFGVSRGDEFGQMVRRGHDPGVRHPALRHQSLHPSGMRQ